MRRYLFVKGENPPFHTFPRTRRQRTEFAAICFFRALGSTPPRKWSAGLRPASRGSAKPAPTTPPPTNLTPTNPRIANRAKSRRAWSAQFSRWGPPTGIARQRETRTDDPAPRQSHGRTHASPTAQNHVEHGALASSPGGGLRPASRGSAKPAPTTPRPANLTAANPRIANREESRGHGALASSPGGGLRPASRGSAKPAPTTPPPANLTATNPRIATTQNHGDGAQASSVSDRHRAAARNPHHQPRPPPISRPQTHASPTAQNHAWSAGLRPASRGSAKPAPTTPRLANLTPTRSPGFHHRLA